MPRARTDAIVLGLWPPGLGVVRSLSRAGLRVVGLDWAPDAPGFRSRHCVARRCADPLQDEGALLAQLLDEAARGDRPAVLCAAEEFAWFVARRQAELRGALRFVAPPGELTSLLLDKREQYEAAARAGVPCPRTLYPASADDARAIADAVPYPAVVKPLRSAVGYRALGAAGKCALVRSPAELRAAFDRALAAGVPSLVQEVVPGPATSQLEVSAYLGEGGEPLAVFAARKLRLQPPDFGNASCLESVHDERAVALALRYLRFLHWRGFASVELKEDARDGAPRLIELNPEPQNALAADCGVDFPLLEYRDALGQRPPPVRAYAAGVRWWNLPEDVKSFLALRRTGGIGAREWLASCLRARSFATFALDDPLPFAGSYAARTVAAVRRRLRPGRRAGGP